ncbi:RDD family protein [Noviherbaspirillum saxi]|uniref:RDD family protein n=1 Tax=Noviherbaspirillum saxi TaxID=2320863 RepID=A0A3A3FV42_9BURK|nr:RDD family protein [Noviherbaspirillum saxi]
MKRRLASMTYEAMLLFGVAFVSGLVFATAMQQKHALYMRHTLQAFLFVVIGLYFIWCWVRSGQTLAMKTWHVKLVTVDNMPIDFRRATIRYFLGWMWVLPGLLAAWALDVKDTTSVSLLIGGNVVLWTLTAFLDPQRQFLHDRIAGTRIIQVPKQ